MKHATTAQINKDNKKKKKEKGKGKKTCGINTNYVRFESTKKVIDLYERNSVYKLKVVHKKKEEKFYSYGTFRRKICVECQTLKKHFKPEDNVFTYFHTFSEEKKIP